MSESPSRLQRVIDWLRVDYPGGVPVADHVVVLSVLSGHLSDEDIQAVVHALAEHAAEAGQPISVEEITAQLAERAHEKPSIEDVQRVSAGLAQAGWPLEELDEEGDPSTDVGPLSRIVSWVREGYPTGVPDQDYVPLLALLRRRLTDREVKAVSKRLRKSGIAPTGVVDISNEIIKVTHELPSKADIMRVHAHLAKKGWPTEFPDPD